MGQSARKPLLAVIPAVLTMTWALACAAAAPVRHDLTISIDPQRGRIQGTDRLTLPEEAVGPLIVELNAAFDLRVQGARVESLGVTARERGVSIRRWRITPGGAVKTLDLRYQGHPATSEPTRADAILVLAADDVYLAPQSAWYPQVPDRPVTFRLHPDVPCGWRTVSQGRRHRRAPDGPVQWVSRQPSRGIYLIAAPFTVYQRRGAEAEALVYLRRPDAPLARRYLEATAKYLRLYSALIGPYPYAKFALVENTRQTGYGMPSFSLIGSRVLRLPFIPYTSYPHEILHNWWGNSVWVDYASGNWAEGLTTYLADQLLAERRGRGAEVRRAALQKYADFVAHARDFPLTAFKARHGEVTQAVGYDKGMMLFHMLRMRIGDARFIRGLRRFYDENRFRAASYADLRRAFEAASGEDLGRFFRQWIERTGAPQLALEAVRVDSAAGGYRLRGVLSQTQPAAPYRLRVPLAVQAAGRNNALETVVELSGRRASFDIPLARRPVRLAVDPRYDLFRRLGAAELPASLGRLFGAERQLLVLPARASAAMRAAYRQLAERWARPGDRIVEDRSLAALPETGAVWLLGWRNRFRDQMARALSGTDAKLGPLAAVLNGKQYQAAAASVVLTAAHNARALGWIGASSAAAAQRLTEKLPHYSRYSYLVFAGETAALEVKGEWPVRDSPLNRALVPAAPPLSLAPRAPLWPIR